MQKLDLRLRFNLLAEDGAIEVERSQLALLGRRLPYLEEFCLVRHTLAENSLLEFLETTPHLTDLKIAYCRLILSEDLLKQIVHLRERQASQRSADVLPLRIFVHEVPPELENFKSIVTMREWIA